MVNEQLVGFIKQELEKGAKKEIISKMLLDNDWTIQDIEEAFTSLNILNQAKIQALNQSESQSQAQTSFKPQPEIKSESAISASDSSPILNTLSDFHTSKNWVDAPVGKYNHDVRNVFLIVLGLLLFTGIIFILIFRNDIPIIKDFIKNNQTPIADVNKSVNIPSQNQVQQPENTLVNQLINQPIQQNQNIDTSNVNSDDAIFERLNNAITDKSTLTDTGFTDCRANINCFIEAANNCQISGSIYIQNNKIEPSVSGAVSDGTYVYKILGKEKDLCVFQMNVSNFKLKPINILPKESLSRLDELSVLFNGSETTCKLNLSKKMGDILSEELIFNKENFITDSKTSTNANNSTIINTYKSGMICTQISSIVANKN